MTPLDITTAPSAELRFAVALRTGFAVFCGLLAVGSLLAFATRALDPEQQASALFVGVLGAVGAVFGLRRARQYRGFGEPLVVARLDAEGLHLHDGIGLVDVPEDLAWTTVPWAWVTAVSHTSFDLRSTKLLAAGDAPIDVLRFTVADDTLLDAGHIEQPHLGHVAAALGLTPTQARTVLVAGKGDERQRAAVAWLQAHRPDLPLLQGSTAPWTTRATTDRVSEQPRVAVVGAHGRLGRHLVDTLVARGELNPVAVVRNEAHRALLERAGAEVRMVDVETQGPFAVAGALRGCAAVLHAGPVSPDVVENLLDAAHRAKVERVALVVSRQDGVAVSKLAGSGLQWAAFRPGSLTDATATGEVALGLDVSPGPVPRADLAEVLVASIRSEDAVGEVWPIAGAGLTLDKPD